MTSDEYFMRVGEAVERLSLRSFRRATFYSAILVALGLSQAITRWVPSVFNFFSNQNGYRPISLKFTLNKKGFCEYTLNAGAYTPKCEPCSHSQQFAGETFL